MLQLWLESLTLVARRARELRTPTPDLAQIRYVATLYLPDYTASFLVSPDNGGFLELSRGVHNLGEALMVPIVNRPQMWQPLGTSELADVIPLSDAACKIATDMMASAEFHAMPVPPFRDSSLVH